MGVPVRLALLLLLFPLSALAACPAGIQLSNLPIGTPLPMCIKFESSSLGGCNAGCPGVCVELPSSGTMGPIQTLGTECSYSEGGGDGEGGDNGGGDGGTGGDNSSLSTKKINPQLVGENHTADLSVGFNVLFLETSVMKNKLSQIASGTHSFEITSRQMLKQLQDIEYNTNRDDNAVSQAVGESNFYLKSILDKLDAEDVPATPDGYLDGKFGELFGRMDRDYYGGIQNIDRSTSSSAQNLAAITSQLGTNGVNGHLMDIKSILESGSSGGSGTGEGSDIDYSKMPGSSENGLSVKQAVYSRGCTSGSCFDQVGIQAELANKKAELVSLHKTIGEEMAGAFKYELSGSADVPKCFDLFSYNGASYDVCLDSGEYWQSLAALLMFIFYFVALMIIFRR